MKDTLKIVTWNCNGALRKKFHELDRYEADIVIVQECEDPFQSTNDAYRVWAKNYLWTGENKDKGLGIFAHPSLSVEPNNWDADGAKYFISCRVDDRFDLVGVWCHRGSIRKYDYIGQMWKYLQVNKMRLNCAVVAGDFNSNKIWDRKYAGFNHSEVVREFEEQGMLSLYHAYHNEMQGAETRQTFYMYRNKDKPYHIDYFFASERLYNSIVALSIGEREEWMEFSDHVPVYAELILKNGAECI